MKVVAWVIVLLTLAVGFHSSGYVDRNPDAKILMVVFVLHAVPVIALLVKAPLVRAFSLWIGVFLIVQYLLSPVLLADRRHFRTLTPNANRVIDVVEGIVPGVEGVQRLTTDERGFRAVPPVDYANKRGFRIFAMGASTTEQIKLDDHATWTYLLQEQLAARSGQPVEVIGTGLSGTRSIHQLATFRHIIGDAPDCAVFLMGVNDWGKQIHEHYGSTQYRREVSPDFLFMETLLGRALRVSERAIYRALPLWTEPNLDGVVRKDYDELRRSRQDTFSKPDKRSLRLDTVDHAPQLEEISELCHSIEGQCLFLSQPHGYSPQATEEFRRRFWMTPAKTSYTLDIESMAAIADLYNSYTRDFARENGHDFIDIAAALPPTMEVFYDDIHFNLAGAQIVANVLTDGFLAGACGFKAEGE